MTILSEDYSLEESKAVYLMKFIKLTHNPTYLSLTIFYESQINIRVHLVYTKFLEVVHSFVCQYNILLLSFSYLDPAFFIG